MNTLSKISAWGDLHHPKVLDIIRMSLGLFLFVKGFIFSENATYLRDLIIENKAISQSPEIITALIYYVTYVHLVGGALIFFGVLTRLWALLELPIVFGAVFLVNILSAFVNSELWLSILILVLLVIFLIIGSGPLSVDHFLSKIKEEEEEEIP